MSYMQETVIKPRIQAQYDSEKKQKQEIEQKIKIDEDKHEMNQRKRIMENIEFRKQLDRQVESKR